MSIHDYDPETGMPRARGAFSNPPSAVPDIIRRDSLGRVVNYSAPQFRALMSEHYGDSLPDVLTAVNRWLARGDSAAVYQNQDLGHPDLGDIRLVSFGSIDALLEPRCDTCGMSAEQDEFGSWIHCVVRVPDDHAVTYSGPPERLPDVGGQVNWRYVLEGTYRGEQIEP